MAPLHLESLMLINAYLLEEQSCHISSRSNLKRRRLTLLFVKKLC